MTPERRTAQTDSADLSADNCPKSLPPDSVVNTVDRATRFWQKYSKEAGEHDEDFIEKNGDNIEGVMLFAGLFSAVAAAFLAAMQAGLSPNPADTTNALLMMLVHSSNNSAFADQDLAIPVWNGPSSAAVCSQILGYAALSASLLAALGAVLGKQWLSDFNRLRSGPLQERSRKRQQKLDGLKTWQFGIFMGALPALIQLALLLFSISLAINLWELNHAVGSIVVAATAIGVFFYLFITLASLLFPNCPFQTPVSSTIHAVVGITMKSVAEVAEYWAWYTNKPNQKKPMVGRGNTILAYVTAVLVSPLLATATAILLAIFATFGSLVTFATWVRGRGAPLQAKSNSFPSLFRFKALQPRLHASICWVRDSARRARGFLRRTYLEPQPDSSSSDPRAIAWLLETSTEPDSLMAAAELVPDVKWPEDLDISLPTEHIYSIFIRSIPERTFNDRAIRLGKAFIIMLCQVSKEVSTHVWKLALTRVMEVLGSLNSDSDVDLIFILFIVTKLLTLKLGSTSLEVEFPSTIEVSQPLLAWLLQPLESLLLLEHPQQSRFFPEAYRAFLKLKWPEELKLEGIQEDQYYRTFEIYFNSVVGENVEKMEEVVRRSLQEPNKPRIDPLKRILEKLKQVDLLKLPLVHQHLIVPLTVLSRLASVPYLKQAFEDTVINPWMIQAFKEAVAKAGESEDSIWLFASCLIKLATAVDAFAPTQVLTESPPRSGDSRGQTPTPLLRMDSKSLLSFLLNKVTPPSAEQAVYALEIISANPEELPDLAPNPEFVNYILYATGPGQVYSIYNVGLKVLIATCQHLLHTYDAQSLTELSTHCDLMRFIRRAILKQDSPTILKDLLTRDDGFNANLLRILAPVLGDPFNTLSTKLGEEPTKIPERDLRDLEIVLVLSSDDGRKELLYDHLDSSIALMPLRGYESAMALPFVVIVGWLLRPNGPLNSSKNVWRALLRPNFEELLFPAWGDQDALEDNPQMLRLLLDCTAKWLSTFTSSKIEESPSSSSPPASPSPLTLTRLDYALDQLKSPGRALSSDIKRALVKLSREIKLYIRD